MPISSRWRRRGAIAGALTIVCAGAAGSQARPAPTTVAILPADVPPRVDSALRRAELIDSVLASELERAGYRVVPVAVSAPVAKHVRDSAGGAFDPRTGARDRVKERSVRRAILAALASEHAAMLVEGHVFVEMVEYKWGKLVWRGVKTAVEDTRTSGTTSVVGLEVAAFDTTGGAIHCGSGGIGPLARFRGNRLVKPATIGEVVADVPRLVDAVRYAAKSLFAHAPVCPQP